MARAVGPMGWWVAWRSPFLSSSALAPQSLGAPPIFAPSHPLFASRSPFAAESWSLAPDASSRCVHEETVTLKGHQTNPHTGIFPPTLLLTRCSWLLNSLLLALCWRGSPRLQLRFESCAWLLSSWPLRQFLSLRDPSVIHSLVFGGSDVVLLICCCALSLPLWMAGICQF